MVYDIIYYFTHGLRDFAPNLRSEASWARAQDWEVVGLDVECRGPGTVNSVSRSAQKLHRR